MRALLLTLFVAAPAAGQSAEFAALEARAVRPTHAAFRWQAIPWLTDAAPALVAARLESRPLFVWIAGGRDRDGSPLERC